MLREIDSLPEDLEILKIKLNTILFNYSILTDTIELIRYLSHDSDINYQLEKASSDLSLLQESADTTENDDWKEEDDFLKKELSQLIEGINLWQLQENWPDKFIYWLESNNTSYYSIENYTSDTQVLSGYYSVVKSITKGNENFEIKGVLFNWLEHYLVGDFDKAYSILIDTRNSRGVGNSEFYEFLAASYSNISQFDKNVRDILVKGEDRELKRIVFYLERIKDARSLDILERTGRYIYDRVITVLSKVYLNIAHAHFKDGLPKGRSKKRDVIKRCIDCFCQLRGVLDTSNDLDVVYMLLMELDGVSKFPWIDTRSDSLTNTTTYDAVGRRKQLLGMIPDEGVYCDKLIGELEIKISELQKHSSFQEDIADRILNFCRIAYTMYGDNRFLRFVEIIARGKKIILQKSHADYDTSVIKERKDELSDFLLKIGIAPYFVSEKVISDITTGIGLVNKIVPKEFSRKVLVEQSSFDGNYSLLSDEAISPDPNQTQYYSGSIKKVHSNPEEDKDRRDYASKIIMLIVVALFLMLLLRAYDLNYVSPVVAIISILLMGTGCVIVSLAANE